jgi:hypothetical protein
MISPSQHSKGPAKLDGHDVDPDNFAFTFRQLLQPIPHRLSPGFRPKENSGQSRGGHGMTVSFMIQLPSKNSAGSMAGRPFTNAQPQKDARTRVQRIADRQTRFGKRHVI